MCFGVGVQVPSRAPIEVYVTDYSKILADLTSELNLCLDHLQYSYGKVQKLKLSSASKDPDSLETYEALVARFARVTDIFIAKYLRSFSQKDDPAFQGSLVDTIHYAEKKGLIISAKVWIEIRELRNKISHEYATKDLKIIFDQVIQQTPVVLSLKTNLK